MVFPFWAKCQVISIQIINSVLLSGWEWCSLCVVTPFPACAVSFSFNPILDSLKSSLQSCFRTAEGPLATVSKRPLDLRYSQSEYQAKYRDPRKPPVWRHHMCQDFLNSERIKCQDFLKSNWISKNKCFSARGNDHPTSSKLALSLFDR